MPFERNYDGLTHPQFAAYSHMEPWYFRCNGASAPTDVSPSIASVARVDNGAAFWYRLTFKNTAPYYQWYADMVKITNLSTTFLEATRLTQAVPTTQSLAAPNTSLEVDIAVQVSGGSSYTNSHAADHYVSGCIWADCAGRTTIKA